MKPSFSPRLELEMLNGVRHVYALAVDARLTERFVQEKPGRADERAALTVFLIPRLLADQHNLCVLRTLPEYGLGRVFPQRTRLTGRGLATQALDFIVRPVVNHADTHGRTKYSTRIQARIAKATLPMST